MQFVKLLIYSTFLQSPLISSYCNCNLAHSLLQHPWFIFPLTWEVKLHAHTEQQLKLYSICGILSALSSYWNSEWKELNLEMCDGSPQCGEKQECVLRLTIVVKLFRVMSSPENRSKSGHKNNKQIVWKYVTVQILGDDNNKSEFDSGGN
jgi:hypothetical protein